MFVLIGMIVVIASVIGGYAAMGAHLAVLWQPLELVIIGGAGVGAYIIANPKSVLTRTGGAFASIFKGQALGKEDFIEVLTMLFTLFRTAKTKGMLELEAHIEKPEESDLFAKFPKFLHNHEALTFLCDYMRMITMGSEDPNEIEDLMNQELDVHHFEQHQMVHALQNMGDGFPALGIVAAVLGVIKTMGKINSPPEILGKYIGGALVGTFLGILLSYGFVGPMANLLGGIYSAESKYLEAIKAGIVAYLKGSAPAVAVEFARKSIPHDCRPSFYDVESALNNLNSNG